MIRKNFIKHLPLLITVLIVCIIAFKNIVPGTYFSGWDNSHPEFNLPEFTKRVISGAWVEFQGTGAPAAQSQLVEVARLPYIYLLKLFVPDNLNRYFFTFLMVLIGSMTMYFYLTEIWLEKIKENYRYWLAGFGGLYYVLNIISLQQFFINFEQFAVEFAYFPLVLLAIHKVSERFTRKRLLFLVCALILFIPTAFVSTIFFIALAFFIVYAFFVNLETKKNFFQALKTTSFISLLMIIVNSYWLFPNIYYILHDSHYVEQSRANGLFDAEAMWSVREAGTIQNFLTGVHFIFNWQDFNFATSQYELIYDVWIKYLSNPIAVFLLIFFNLISVAGFATLLIDVKKGIKRWGLIFIYVITTLFIWIGLFLPNSLTEFIYKFGLIRESFRNPFTKFSNYYSFAVTVMLCLYLEKIVSFLHRLKSRLLSFWTPVIIFIGLFIFLITISWPSFAGNFLNSKLRDKIPQEYFDMFTYLKTQPTSDRVLELPFMSHEGWLYYNWPFDGAGNGYQGEGFYLYGFPQALITPDHARWTETTDFFYYELRHAINSQNPAQFKEVLEKYHVNMVVVDETSVWKYSLPYDYTKLHQILTDAGYSQIWNENFLSIYKIPDQIKVEKLLIPKQINFVSANTDRVQDDYAYQNVGEYITSSEKKATTLFPFADLTSLTVDDAQFNSEGVKIERKITPGSYSMTIPGIKKSFFTTKAYISYVNKQLNVVFPTTAILAGGQEITLPQLQYISISTSKNYNTVALWIDDQLFQINNNQVVFPSITVNLSQPLSVYYSGIDNMGVIDYQQIKTSQPDWSQWKRDIVINDANIDSIKLISVFPLLNADLNKFIPANCSNPQTGSINTVNKDGGIYYTAENYGVSCGHFNSNYFTPDASYLMQISGGNYQGRSIKFFIDYNVQNSLPEEYLMPETASYSKTLGFMPIVQNTSKSYAINWETRSFGKTSSNYLSSIKIIPFPIERLSQIQLKKTNYNSQTKNNLTITDSKFFLTFLYSVKISCPAGNCYFGINQAYDDLWIAFDNNFHILPHFRYNNWANLWQVDGSTQITVIYLPQIFAFIGFIFLVIILIILLKADKS